MSVLFKSKYHALTELINSLSEDFTLIFNSVDMLVSVVMYVHVNIIVYGGQTQLSMNPVLSPVLVLGIKLGSSSRAVYAALNPWATFRALELISY